jgi:hypothetical protein
MPKELREQMCEDAMRTSRSKRSAACASRGSSRARDFSDLTWEPDVLGSVRDTHPAFAGLSSRR